MNFVRLAKERPLAVDGVEALRLADREVKQPHGTDLESRLLDALNNTACVPCGDGIRLDDGQCTFHIEELYVGRKQGGRS